MTRSVELVSNGMALLMHHRRRPTPPIGTQLPQGAPATYARSQLGPRTIAWMQARGWIDRRYVMRLEPAVPSLNVVA